MEEIVDTLKQISSYVRPNGDSWSGTTIKLLYWGKHSYAYLSIQSDNCIRWEDVHPNKEGNYACDIPIDTNNPIFVRKLKHMMNRNSNLNELVSNKLFKLEEEMLMRI